MSDFRWKQVEQLFAAAQQQPAHQRAEFLRSACGDDVDLCVEVESLLKAADTGDHLLDGSPLSSIAERPPALKPGDKLGNFQIVALIGRGGMGEVYRARDLRLKREVAIKTLPAGFAGDRDRIARFEREARAASALNHPNIVSVYDIGTEGGISFIVSELVDGEILAKLLGHGPLPIRKLIEISTQICEGLAAAHTAGVIHRDLKPGNIMLTRDVRVKILDFGLACQNRAHGLDSTTMEASHLGLILGTPGYMSPEQVRGEPTDARSDLFSLGVVLYEMASGKRAFQGASSIEVMNSILKDDPPELPKASPPSLDRIIRRCIEKQPSSRFQSAADLGFALQSLAGSAARTASPKTTRRATAAALRFAAVATLIAALLGAFLWLSRPPAVPRVIGTAQITNDGLYKEWLLTDGGRLLFHSTASRVYQVSVKGGEPLAIPISGRNAVADISPDHTELLECRFVYRNGGPAAELWVTPALTGPSRRLGNVLTEAINMFCQAAWSPDGRQVAYGLTPPVGGTINNDALSPNGRQVIYGLGGELRIIRADGTGDHRLAGFVGFLNSVRWSPDGRKVRFSVFRRNGGDTTSSLWEAPVGGDRATPLLTGWNAGRGNWTPDGRYFVFEANRNGNWAIWALRESAGLFGRAPREPVQLTNGPMEAHWPVPSVDGKRIFFVGSTPRNEFVRYDPKSGQLASAFGGISGTDLDFSSDGKWAAYVSVPDRALWRCAADGTQCIQLTSPPLAAAMPRWSPDGTRIAFSGAGTGERWQVYLIPSEGGAPQRVTSGQAGWAGDSNPTWSPDGASIAFGTPAHSSPPPNLRLYRLELGLGRVSALPGSEGMWFPSWSPDGRVIAGLSGGSSKPMLYDLRTRKQSQLFDQASLYPSWSTNGEFLFFRTRPIISNSCWRLRMSDRRLERILDMMQHRFGVDYGWFTVIPGGQIMTTRSLGTEEIYALNWEAP